MSIHTGYRLKLKAGIMDIIISTYTFLKAPNITVGQHARGKTDYNV